jgi:hypothetical protein
VKAYRIVRENNKVGRERQKEQYNKRTQLIVIYLREMITRTTNCPKFRIRWRDSYEVVHRLSDLNYLVGVSWNKELVVNVNKMKKKFRKTADPPPAAAHSDDKGQGVINVDGLSAHLCSLPRTKISWQDFKQVGQHSM